MNRALSLCTFVISHDNVMGKLQLSSDIGLCTSSTVLHTCPKTLQCKGLIEGFISELGTMDTSSVGVDRINRAMIR